MNKNICVVCGWQRPEYLQVWMENIQKCDNAENVHYLFALDYGYSVQYLNVIKKFPFKNTIGIMQKTNYKLGKQSYNVMNAMLTAATHTKELVYYIEEDIFVAKDYFTFMDELHKKEKNIFCSIGTRCNNTKWKTNNDENSYYLSPNPDYQSWASCFKKEIIIKYIKPHFNINYFGNPNKYCAEKFPKSIVGSQFTEQDGLIRRIKEKEAPEMYIAYPHVPRGYHAGFYGYNRQNNIPKDYNQRVDLLKKVCFDKEMMKKYCLPGLYEDSIPVNLKTKHEIIIKKECYA